MANRLTRSQHALKGSNKDNAARKKDGTKNRGMAAMVKTLKRFEAIERQQKNIDRGYYLCHDDNSSCPGRTAITLAETDLSEAAQFQYHGFHAHTPMALESQIRDKNNEKRMVANF